MDNLHLKFSYEAFAKTLQIFQTSVLVNINLIEK